MNSFNTLRFFLHVAKVGSFTQTANDLGVKTSTISRHISDLEKELGIALINRTTRGMTLTEGGRVFYQNIKPALEIVEQAREAASSLNRLPSGELHLSISPAICHHYLLPNLTEFARRYPNIQLRIHMASSPPEVIGMGVDLSIQSGHLADSSIMARRLQDHWYIACCNSTLINELPSISTLEEVLQNEIMLAQLKDVTPWFAIQSGRTSSCSFNSRFILNDDYALLSVMLQGGGIGLLPYWLAWPHLQNGTIHHLLPEVKFSQTKTLTGMWAAYSYKKTVSSKVRALIDFLVEKVEHRLV